MAQYTVHPAGILAGDKIVDQAPYRDHNGSKPTKPLHVKDVETNPRWGCKGTHVNDSLCFTLPVVVERS